MRSRTEEEGARTEQEQPEPTSDSDNGDAAQAERDALAETQNAPGSVPETRPQKFGRQGADSEGVLHKQLRENDALPGAEAHDQEAYDRADSDEQRNKAADQERTPNIDGAARVKVIKGKHEGRFGAIIDTSYDGPEEHAKAMSGAPDAKAFAKVDHYTVRTRDGRHELIDVKPDEVREASVAEYSPVT